MKDVGGQVAKVFSPPLTYTSICAALGTVQQNFPKHIKTVCNKLELSVLGIFRILYRRHSVSLLQYFNIQSLLVHIHKGKKLLICTSGSNCLRFTTRDKECNEIVSDIGLIHI